MHCFEPGSLELAQEDEAQPASTTGLQAGSRMHVNNLPPSERRLSIAQQLIRSTNETIASQQNRFLPKVRWQAKRNRERSKGRLRQTMTAEQRLRFKAAVVSFPHTVTLARPCQWQEAVLPACPGSRHVSARQLLGGCQATPTPIEKKEKTYKL